MIAALILYFGFVGVSFVIYWFGGLCLLLLLLSVGWCCCSVDCACVNSVDIGVGVTIEAWLC